MMALVQNTRQRGFTLVEAIMVMVLIGVLSAVVAVFIRAPVQNYADSASRAELVDTADLALRRLSRDLRAALPNSVRVAGDGHAIEFLPTKGGGRYLAAEDGVADAATEKYALDFLNGVTKFSIVGALPGMAGRITANSDYVVVYNLGIPPQDAYQIATPTAHHNIARIVDVKTGLGGLLNIQMADNPFSASATLTDPALQPSPTQRFQIAGSPVYYSCESKNGVLTLTRYTNYAITAAMSNTPPAGATQTPLAHLPTHQPGGHIAGTARA
jgi:MSHA biogenesis protein MshO